MTTSLSAPSLAEPLSRPVNHRYMSPEARFWARVDKRGPDECWEWQGRRARHGYGTFGINRRTTQVHRFSLALSGVEVPADLDVCHSCDNPPCVNPAHLWLGTAKDNGLDMAAKGRGRNGSIRGMDNYRAQINDDIVRDIRRSVLRGERKVAIARRLGIKPNIVYNVSLGYAWRHVKDLPLGSVPGADQ